MLRTLVLQQLKIKNQKVRRFIVLESDFALNVMGKLMFYLSVLPQEIALIRSNHSEYPEDEFNLYHSCLRLETQVEKTSSSKMAEAFQIYT